jgi:hypothetical protein
MLKPIVNPGLSLRARSLFYYFVEKGKLMSADELWESKEFPEGRDALVNALNELKAFKYVRAVRTHVNGRWAHQLKFTEPAVKMLEEAGVNTTPWKSGHMYVYRDTSVNTSTSTSDLTASSQHIDTVTNVTVSIPEQAREEGEVMAWNLDGEEEAPKKRGFIEDLDAGAVGKVEDRQKKLNEKYKRATKSEHAGRNRRDVPEVDWTTTDLIAEFYTLADAKAPGVPGQVNQVRMAGWINKQIGLGTERVAILAAIRMFFADPRMLNDLGIGKPLYQRFFGYYLTVHGVVTKKEQVIYEDQEFLAHQEKMLRLLRGE